MMDKSVLRKSMLAERAKLTSQQQAQAAEAFTMKALAFLADKHYQTIAGYYPFRNELNILPLLEILRLKGKTILLPRTPTTPAPLTFHRYHDDILEEGKYSIRQPNADSPVESPDILLVPLVAFDTDYHRLGYGGGYYDRTLASLSPRLLTIGCAYNFQQVDTLQPEAHDEKLDKVISV